MRKSNIIELSSRETRTNPLSELLLSGAQKLIYQAVETELSGFLDGFIERRTPSGHAGVVRNGYIPVPELPTSLGQVTITIPKVRSKTREPVTFQLAPIPPILARRVRKEAALPWLYLKGISLEKWVLHWRCL